MRYNNIVITTLALLFVLLSTGNAQCSASTPQEHVRNFYMWYGEKYLSSKTLPEESDEILKFVNPCTIKRLRIDLDRASLEVDYFYRTQDAEREVLDGLIVHDAIAVNDHQYVVPVTIHFGERTKPHLLVFVEKEKGAYTILKVEAVYHYYGM